MSREVEFQYIWNQSGNVFYWDCDISYIVIGAGFPDGAQLVAIRQFTGCITRGKKTRIYDGDILEVANPQLDGACVRFVVEYHGGTLAQFMCRAADGTGNIEPLSMFVRESDGAIYEVAGNIHENEDLLK